MSFLKKIQSYGSRNAITDTRRHLTYAQLYRSSWALASQLNVKYRQTHKRPIEQPRVMYMTHRDMLYPMSQLATWHLDGVAIPISSSSRTKEIEYLLHDSQADIVICHEDFKKKFKDL